MALKIVHYGNPILHQKGEKVTAFNAELARLADEMVATMHEAEGIGLAAQQVGIARQFCVIDLRGTEREFIYRLDGGAPPLELIMPMQLANPAIEPETGQTTNYEEGCLSFPGIRGDVVRPDAIRVRFLDLQGQQHEMTCNGLLARCIQHEVDHLNGVLFIDRMAKTVRAPLNEALRELKKKTRTKPKS